MKNYKYILNHSVKGSLTLENSPVNWLDKNITFTRHDVYKSVLSSFSLELGFPFEGAEYLKDVYETYGIDEEVTITITQLDKSDYTYKAFYAGIIDFSTYRYENNIAYCEIVQNDVLSQFLNRADISIDLTSAKSLSDDTLTAFSSLTRDMLIKKLDIYVASLFKYESPLQVSYNETYGSAVSWDEYFGFGSDWDVNEIGDDATLPNTSGDSSRRVIYTNSGSDDQIMKLKFKGTISGSITITGTGNWTAGILIKSRTSTWYTFSDSGTGAETVNISLTDIDENHTNTISPAGTHALDVEFFGTTDNAGVQSIEFDITLTDINIQLYKFYLGRTAEDKEVVFPHEAAAKLIQIMTGDNSPLYSTILGRTDSELQTYASDGDLSLIGLSSGYMLRGFSTEEKGLSFSFMDLFKSLSAISPLGLWYDNANERFDIESIENYYDTSEILDIGEVSDLVIEAGTEYFFNSIVGGYSSDLDYDDVGGMQNFNCSTEWTNSIKRVINQLDISSPFRADDYGIELARQKPSDEFYGDDMDSDEDIFMVYGVRDGADFESVQGYDDFDVIDNIYSDSSRLNVDLSPARNLLRNKSLVAVGAYKNLGDVKFSTSTFRLDLGTQKSGEPSVLYEKDNITASTLDEPLFYPELYIFNAPVTREIFTQLLADPHGYVTFTHKGEEYKGHIIEVSTEPFRRSGNWTLIKHNTNR